MFNKMINVYQSIVMVVFACDTHIVILTIQFLPLLFSPDRMFPNGGNRKWKHNKIFDAVGINILFHSTLICMNKTLVFWSICCSFYIFFAASPPSFLISWTERESGLFSVNFTIVSFNQCQRYVSKKKSIFCWVHFMILSRFFPSTVG